MNYLLDTNVISEWVKPHPDPGVIQWLLDADEDRVHVSVISFAEIRHGIELLPRGPRRTRLTDWLQTDLTERFQDRIIGVDREIAEQWGICMALARKAGITLGLMDAFFAATARAHSLSLVTRNVSHFGELGITLLNPWQISTD